MAENKKSFIFYCDWKDTFDQLPDDKAGQLIKHMLAYVNDESPESEDVLINAVFANMKNTLKRDLVKFEEIKVKRSLAGLKSAELRANKKEQVLTSVESVQQEPTNPTVSVNESVSVSDIDTVNDIKDKKKKTIADKNPLHGILKHIFLIFYKNKTGEEFYWDAKNASSLKQLITKTKKKLAEKEIKESDENITRSFEALLSRIQDKWILDNLSMAIINSKFNEIIQNGKQTTGEDIAKRTDEAIQRFKQSSAT